MISKLQDVVLNEIKERGFFCFYPNRWNEFSEVIDEMLKLKLIQKLSDFIGYDHNASYVYVKFGNPNKVICSDKGLTITQ